MHDEAYEAVAIGCSAGGLRALKTILGALPAAFPAPIFLAMHRGDAPADYLVALLRQWTELQVRTAQEAERPQAGSIYIAPGGRHIELVRGRLSVRREGRIKFVCPNVDILFESVARCYGRRGLAMVLSGQGSDGSAGALAVRSAGGYVLAQDPRNAEHPGMPSSAIETRKVDLVLPLERLAYALDTLLTPAVAA